MTATGEPNQKMRLLNSLMRSLTPIPEGAEYPEPAMIDLCPECGDAIPEETETEGPVYWKVTDEPFCGMECVVKRHRKWLKEQRGIAGN